MTPIQIVPRAVAGRSAVILAVGVCAVLSGCGSKSAAPAPKVRPLSHPTPRVVKVIAHRLVARKIAVQRSALSPALALVLPRKRLLPLGSKLLLDPHGWRQTGRFANATGTLQLPKGDPRSIEIGFMHTTRGWRVTFMEDIS